MFRQYVYLYFTIYQNNLILGMPVPNKDLDYQRHMPRSFCVQLRWDGGIDDHHRLNFLFVGVCTDFFIGIL
jgi:hypothetical protein